MPEEASLRQVISHVHQIGWQLRLGEHIQAKQQEEMARAMCRGREATRLNNDAYRLRLPEPGSNPFANLGKPGYEAETRELLRFAEEVGLPFTEDGKVEAQEKS